MIRLSVFIFIQLIACCTYVSPYKITYLAEQKEHTAEMHVSLKQYVLEYPYF